MLQLGWFSTGRGPGSRALLTTVQNAIQTGKIQARIQFVFSNREPAEAEGSDQFFELARGLGLDLVCHSSRSFRRSWTGDRGLWREAYDREVMAKLRKFNPDICVLAGYMLIVGPEMCNRYTMINLHPAAPDGPEGTWQDVIWTLLEQGATKSGVKIHMVTEELDRGPTIAYCTYPIRGPDFDEEWARVSGKLLQDLRVMSGEKLPLFKMIRRAGAMRELPLLVETLKSIADGDVDIDLSNPIEPRDLTAEIEETIGRS